MSDKPTIISIKSNGDFQNVGDGSTYTSATQTWSGSWKWGGGESRVNDAKPIINLQ